jgi:phosphoglycerate dehydrogenase-like enzyme
VNTPRILIPNTITWALPELPLEVEHFDVQNPPTESDAVAMAVWGIPRKVLGPLLEFPSMRWIQSLTAGIDHVLDSSAREDLIVCNGRGLHDAPTAEMAVALLLEATRGLHFFRDQQHKAIWDRSAYANQLEGRAKYLGTLEGTRILILGMGTIGLEIARRLQPFGAIVEGVATTEGERDGFPTHDFSSLDELLPEFDALVMVLPDTPETQNILSRDRLAKMKSHAWVVNVGRGSAIDEPALIEALEAGQIGGAALDVASREPLPAESKLWTLENVILAPHVAGGGPRFYQKASDLLARNARAFVNGEALENIISRARGY